jgi:hypothetical protein
MDGYRISLDPVPNPEIKSGDSVRLIEQDGTEHSLLVTTVEPYDDEEEDGAQGQRITFLAWPGE